MVVPIPCPIVGLLGHGAKAGIRSPSDIGIRANDGGGVCAWSVWRLGALAVVTGFAVFMPPPPPPDFLGDN